MSEKHPQTFLCRRIMVVKQGTRQLVFKTSSLPQGVLTSLACSKRSQQDAKVPYHIGVEAITSLENYKTGREKGKAQGWVVMPLPPPEQRKGRFSRCCFKVLRRTGEVAPQGKVLNAEPDDLGSALKKHTVEGENWLPHTVLTFAHACDKILGSVDLP